MAALEPGFRRFLLGVIDISERDLDKLVDELLDHWSETTNEYVARRHRELQHAGVPNRDVYGQVALELGERRFGARPMTLRQIRRRIYG
jgi:hypothetical protein